MTIYDNLLQDDGQAHILVPNIFMCVNTAVRGIPAHIKDAHT